MGHLPSFGQTCRLLQDFHMCWNSALSLSFCISLSHSSYCSCLQGCSSLKCPTFTRLSQFNYRSFNCSRSHSRVANVSMTEVKPTARKKIYISSPTSLHQLSWSISTKTAEQVGVKKSIQSYPSYLKQPYKIIPFLLISLHTVIQKYQIYINILKKLYLYKYQIYIKNIFIFSPQG